VILVAAVGNLWLGDDGFGCEVAKRLRTRDLGPRVAVADFGSGGLDLAYEVLRGYDALVLVDVSRQGEAPGTLYLMEVEPESVEGGLDDETQIDPHGMDPQTVLRFVKATGGWPGKVVVIACEPENVEEFGLGLTPAVEAAVDRAVELVVETIGELSFTSSR
jgi:hydrogenase maturation protease